MKGPTHCTGVLWRCASTALQSKALREFATIQSAVLALAKHYTTSLPRGEGGIKSA